MSATIYKDLFDRFRESGFPSDESLQHDLVADGGFNPNSVRGFIRDWKESLKFSGLTDEDGGILLSKYSGEGWLNDDPAPDPMARLRPKSGGQGDAPLPKPPRRRAMTAGMKEDVYTLGTCDAVLQWPSSITQDEYDELSDWLDLMKRKMQRSIGAAVDDSLDAQSEGDGE